MKQRKHREGKTLKDGGEFQFLGYAPRISHRTSWGLRRKRPHDPMLVLNMSMFNLANGWNRVFNPLRVHENGNA